MKSRNLLAAVCLLLSIPAFAHSEDAPDVKESQLGKTRNVHRCGQLFLAGQHRASDLDTIKKSGIKRIITLRTDGELDWDQAAAVEAAQLELVKIPLGSPDDLTDEVFAKIRKLLSQSKQTPTLLHCGSANRVGAAWMAYRVLDQKVELETAAEEAKTIGLRSPQLEAKARDYIKRKSNQ